MRTKSACLVLALIVLALTVPGPLLAQTKLVFPDIATNSEGSISANDFKGGAAWWTSSDTKANARNFRYQLVSDLPSATKGKITGISFRRDGVIGLGVRTQSFTATFEIWMSTSPKTSATVSDTFADNIGNDTVKVLDMQRLIFGAKPFDGSFPEKFNFDITFDRPFTYDASKGSLCYEVRHQDNTLYDPHHGHGFTVNIDATQSSRETVSLSSASRCFSPNPWNPPITFTQHLELKDVNGKDMIAFHAERKYAHHHSLGLLVLTAGMASKGHDFDCGTFMLDLSKAFLYSIEVSDDFGNVHWPGGHNHGDLFVVPFISALAGCKIYGQEINLDVHNLKRAATNWMVSQVPTYLGKNKHYGLRGVYASGPGSMTAAKGTLAAAGSGPVIQYGIQ